MEVVSRSETKLILRRDPLIPTYVGAALILSILITVLIRQAIGEMARVIVSIGIVMSAIILSAMLIGLIARLIPSKTTYTLCKESNRMTIKTEILGRSRVKRHPLHDITAIILRNEGDRHYWVELRLGSEKEIVLPVNNRVEAADIADYISKLLGKHLFYATWETRAPLQEPIADVKSPAHCADCGAPLHLVQTGASHITCKYCGAVLPVEWPSTFQECQRENVEKGKDV